MRPEQTLIFETLLSSQVPVAIFSWRNEEHWPVEFVSPNVHHVLGYTAEDFLSRRVVYADIIHPDDLPRVTREVAEHSASGVPVFEHEDYRIVDPAGTVRWVRDNTAVVRDAEGRITHYFGYILDSTARHEALAAIELARHKAEEAARAKSEFLANVSHELRTPLTLMLGPLEALLHGEAGPLPGEVARILGRVQRSAERQRVLVDDLLDFARLEAGREAVAWEAVDVAGLISGLVDEAKGVAEARGIALSLAVPGEPETVPADRLKLEQIALNLIGNALKFTPAGGRVTVSVAAAGEAIEIAVADTGPGIPADQVERIFERFQQLDTSPARHHEGTGIGLALVKSLTELMGGTVSVESRPGEGARFAVRLPRGADRLAGPMAAALRDQEAHGPTAAARLHPLRPAAPLTGRAGPAGAPRVVVADDNADMRAFLTEVLAGSYEVEAVADGAEALAAIRRDPPAVVVCDVMMPEVDGFTVVRQLKADPRLRAIPVILVTAKAGRQEAVAGLEAGADDYLPKPFAATELRARVHAAERLHRLYLDLARKKDELAEAHAKLWAAQEQLLHAGKLAVAGVLGAGIAHELNNPIATVLLNAQLLLQQVPPDSPLHARLTVIEQQMLRCRNVIRTLLTYARRRPLQTERLSARRIIEEVAILARSQARSHDVVLECPDPPPDDLEVVVCVQEVETALLNVLSNAFDATPPGGRITMRARAQACGGRDGVEFTVVDTGPGIPDEVRPHVFEPFFTTKPVGQGTGLGLALAQRMVNNAGGHIEIESEPGHGTTVRLWLPSALGDESGARA